MQNLSNEPPQENISNEQASKPEAPEETIINQDDSPKDSNSPQDETPKITDEKQSCSLQQQSEIQQEPEAEIKEPETKDNEEPQNLQNEVDANEPSQTNWKKQMIRKMTKTMKIK